jgi:hypothetical protein
MTTNVVNQTPYLRDQREYPEDPKLLALEVNKTYIDIANSVNDRTIAVYPTNRPAITGNKWYIGGKVYQSLRKVFSFTSTTSIDHGINLNTAFSVGQGFGSYTDGTAWYGLVFGTSVAVAGQIGFYLSDTQIIFTLGAGAPALTDGLITIEWLSTV